MNWLYSTEWGLLYLIVLLALMVPALFGARRWLAVAMLCLFICDRAAVNLLPPMLALFFLAFAYTLMCIAVAFTHSTRQAKLVGVTMLVTSLVFIAGGFNFVTWDVAGTVQEICGLIAMLAIISRNTDGARSHAGRDLDDPAWAREHRPATGAHTRDTAHK